MRIAYITAGAAGMYCGSCMRDNTLVAALRKLGHDALLIPTYTPIRTDEDDVSQARVYYGGINVYLEQKFWLFRHTPWLFDRLFNFRGLLRWVSRFAVRTRYSDHGNLAVSMLRGMDGKQRKEVEKLARWLESEVKPEVVILTNALLSGVAPELRRRLGVPVVVTLQGDDIFLDALHEPDRRQCIDLIRRNCSGSHFIATSRYYADYMAGYLGIDRDRIEVIHPGINLIGHYRPDTPREWPLTIGFFARICPEKGFHRVVDAFIKLRQTPGMPVAKLKVGGWLGENYRAYFNEQVERLYSLDLAGPDDFEHVECPTHADKVRFMQSIEVLCVPTVYREPKGLYILEAWANGVPVVQPRHGAFTELVESTGGGLLVSPDSSDELAAALGRMLTDDTFRDKCGRAGEAAVRERFLAAVMARETAALLEQLIRPATLPS